MALRGVSLSWWGFEMTTEIFRGRYFEVSRVSWSWWGFSVNTGYDSHKPYFRIAAFGLWISINLPLWVLAPARRKVAARWDAATVERMGRDWYWDETRREFGIDFHNDAFTLHYGIQPDSWPGDKTIRWTPPWMRWRYIGTKYFDLNGSVFARHYPLIGRAYEESEAIEATVPTVTFAFNDFDGESIAATVRMDESEYACGEGRWSWLGKLRPHRRHRRYDFKFSKETGNRKGSWKGGMSACNGPAEPGELHEAAFRRYCNENRMTFIGLI